MHIVILRLNQFMQDIVFIFILIILSYADYVYAREF